MKTQCTFAHRLFVMSLFVLLFATAPPKGQAKSEADELTLASLKFFIEFNETDEDVGVQTSLGGEPYRKLSAFDPNGRKILDLRPQGSLMLQGLSDFFFESAEPTLEDFPIDEFLSRFPEGVYEFETVTIDGIEQEGETMFTHVIPAGPVILSPQEGDVVDPNNTIVMWEPVTQTTAFNPPQQPCGPAETCKIVSYQVIVTGEDPLRVYRVDVSPDTTSITVPPAFLEKGKEYEVEILTVEESDNQTISLLFFETAE